MPDEGGTPQRASARSTLPSVQLETLDLATGASRPIPLAEASDGAWNEAGTALFFVRLPFQGSHTKRYRGGTVQQLWRWDGGDAEAVPLTADYPGTSRNPMTWSGRVYFLSDRDGTMNLWSMTGDGKDLRQHTVFEHCWTPLDIRAQYNSNKGSIYGVVSDRWKNLAFKAPKQSTLYPNLFFVGGSANPGGGSYLPWGSKRWTNRK